MKTIQFCINGIKVELSDIRGLSPQEVIRVEYHDNPGLRYGNASVVLDYIVRRETSGGSVNLDLSNSPTTSFGDDQVSTKFNHKKSEFGLQYAVRYRESVSYLDGRSRDLPLREWRDDGTVPRKVCQEECPRPLITSLLIIIW